MAINDILTIKDGETYANKSLYLINNNKEILYCNYGYKIKNDNQYNLIKNLYSMGKIQ